MLILAFKRGGGGRVTTVAVELIIACHGMALVVPSWMVIVLSYLRG